MLDPPRRFFFMTARMNGLPVAVLHNYAPERAGMQVRAARLFDVVDLSWPDFARVETVTFLNDLCALAPSALVRPEFVWIPIDDRSPGGLAASPSRCCGCLAPRRPRS